MARAYWTPNRPRFVRLLGHGFVWLHAYTLKDIEPEGQRRAGDTLARLTVGSKCCSDLRFRPRNQNVSGSTFAPVTAVRWVASSRFSPKRKMSPLAIPARNLLLHVQPTEVALNDCNRSGPNTHHDRFTPHGVPEIRSVPTVSSFRRGTGFRAPGPTLARENMQTPRQRAGVTLVNPSTWVERGR